MRKVPDSFVHEILRDLEYQHSIWDPETEKLYSQKLSS